MAAHEEPKRLVFMGTPLFAAAILEKIAAWPKGQIVGVYTQPDRCANRGHKIQCSKVKLLATELGLPIFQPTSFKADSDYQTLAELQPDFLLVAAYGLLLPQRVLDLPKYKALNVHGSLLPKLRGAAPIQRAIYEGIQPHAVTGVSIMEMVKALDAGAVYAQESILIAEHTTDSLLEAMAPLGANLLLSVVEQIIQGSIMPTPQDDSQATYAAKIEKADAVINFKQSACQVHAQIRAVTSQPGAQTTLHFDDLAKTFTIKLKPGRILEPTHAEIAGTLRVSKEALCVACSDFWYELTAVKPEGKAFMAVKAFINGYLRDLPLGICGHIAE